MAKYVLDTNVLIHAMRSEAAARELASWQRQMAPHLYMHAVVMAELLAGARDEATLDLWRERWIAPAERVSRVVSTGAAVWIHAARLLVRLREAGHVTGSAMPRGFLNDCLLAASARADGFIIVTHNQRDFELIARVEPGLAFTAPFP